MKQTNMQEDTSMLNWFPKIEDLIPVPKTEILPISIDDFREMVNLLDDTMISEDLRRRLKASAKKIGYPLFMRSDITSGKHNYEHTCYVTKEKNLIRNLSGLVESHLMKDLFPRAIVFRELLPIWSYFKAFRGHLPIAIERRYFVNEGKVMCHHPYWPKDAIEYPDRENWELLLEDMNKESCEEVQELSKMAIIFNDAVPGFYSVDFALANTGKWYMIDAARGELSWHPGH